MSHLNFKKKILFIHIPKTGGTSMVRVPWNYSNLYSYEGHFTISDFAAYGLNLDEYWKWCFVRNPWSRLLSSYDYSKILKTVYPTFDRFIDVLYEYRKDYSRLNHRWAYPEREGGGIPNLPNGNLYYVFLYNQISLITFEDKIKMDFIGRYENLAEDWGNVCKKMKEVYKNTAFVKEEHFLLPHINKRSDPNANYINKPYQEYYTKEMRDKVAEIYSKDIEVFNYAF
jgi:chondroitin 4-sulfotransferase 11